MDIENLPANEDEDEDERESEEETKEQWRSPDEFAIAAAGFKEIKLLVVR